MLNEIETLKETNEAHNIVIANGDYSTATNDALRLLVSENEDRIAFLESIALDKLEALTDLECADMMTTILAPGSSPTPTTRAAVAYLHSRLYVVVEPVLTQTLEVLEELLASEVIDYDVLENQILRIRAELGLELTVLEESLVDTTGLTCEEVDDIVSRIDRLKSK